MDGDGGGWMGMIQGMCRYIQVVNDASSILDPSSPYR
jgi:hypothetical protein